VSDAEQSGEGSTRFVKDVLYSSMVGITSDALRAAVVALFFLAIALFAVGWEVPAWTLVLVFLLSVGLIYVTKRVGGREAAELRPKLKVAEEKLDRHESYGTNIDSIMDNFQRVLAGDIPGVTVPDFIERGILIAGRDVMRENGHADDLRMSVLLARDDCFTMWKASGHNLQSQQKYRQPIARTVSKIAYEKKVAQVWRDVATEERGFEENPHATRKIKSMVSIPLLVGDQSVGVFNVVTAKPNAFDVADVNYLTSIGAVIQTAVGVAVKDVRTATSPGRLETSPMRKAAQNVPPFTAPKATPGGHIGSGPSTDGKDHPDD
jgi:hypothetical protein